MLSVVKCGLRGGVYVVNIAIYPVPTSAHDSMNNDLFTKTGPPYSSRFSAFI